MTRHDYTLRFRHVDKETNLQKCDVTGTLPHWLNGEILFNGPGLMKIGEDEYNHIFDGSAILQKFVIKNGAVSYCSKYLQSETFKKNKKAGKIMVAEFGTPGPSSQGIMSRFLGALDTEKMFSDNASMQIIKMGSKYFALGNTPFFLEIDPKTLNVINRVNMNKICKLMTQSFWILQDKNGKYYSIGMVLGITGPKYAVVEFPKDGRVDEAKVVATFPCRTQTSPSHVHTAAMTENYLIFIETPLVISLKDILAGFLSNKPFADSLKWQEEMKCVIRVIELKTWKECSTKYITDPFFFLFFGNVYEELNHIVVDVCSYQDSTMMNQMFVKSMTEARRNGHDERFSRNFVSYLHRYILPLHNSIINLENENMITLPNTSCKAFKKGDEIHLTHEVLCDKVPFCSTIVSNSISTSNKKSNIIYACFGDDIPDCNYGTLVKLNIFTKEVSLFYEEDLYASTPIFIPIPDSLEEDDGLLISFCLRSSNPHYIALVIVSAKTMTEVCRAHINLKSFAAMPMEAIYIPAK